MKTLADFKRAMTLGSKWDAYNHLDNVSLGTREVTTVQSNSFAFDTKKADGTTRKSWCEFPKAKDIEFKEGNKVEIYVQWQGSRQKVLTYTLVGKE